MGENLNIKLNDMNRLSLFDGMSCGQIALKESGHEVKYYASEIDKFAIAQTQLNFPDTIQLGDIENWRKWNIDWSKIGLILAGSPCQGFSFAGKQLNFNDPRSKLFFVFVDILNHCKKFNPDVKFLLENVVMKKEYQNVINNTLGLFPVLINSNLVSAQNRKRLYWTNIKIKMIGLFNEIHSDIPQPKDRGILLKDILQPESEVDGKYYLKSGINGLDINKKAPTQRSSTGRCLDKKHNYQFIKLDKQLNKKSDQGLINNIRNKDEKAQCLLSTSHKGSWANGMTNILIPESTKKGYVEINPGDYATTKDNLLMIKMGNIYPSGGENGNIYSIAGKSPTIKSGATSTKGNGGVGSCNSPKITDGYKLRRLTPLECARLQTIPSWYKWNCSDTQQYRMLGNGWTIEVIKHILKYL